MADDSRLRGFAHDPEGSSEVVAERRCPRADPVRPGNPWIEKLNSRYRRGCRLVRFTDNLVFATQPWEELSARLHFRLLWCHSLGHRWAEDEWTRRHEAAFWFLITTVLVPSIS